MPVTSVVWMCICRELSLTAQHQDAARIRTVSLVIHRRPPVIVFLLCMLQVELTRRDLECDVSRRFVSHVRRGDGGGADAEFRRATPFPIEIVRSKQQCVHSQARHSSLVLSVLTCQ